MWDQIHCWKYHLKASSVHHRIVLGYIPSILYKFPRNLLRSVVLVIFEILALLKVKVISFISYGSRRRRALHVVFRLLYIALSIYIFHIFFAIYVSVYMVIYLCFFSRGFFLPSYQFPMSSILF